MHFDSELRDSVLTAFRDSIPVMMGYLPLGFVFGFLFAQAGAAAWMAPVCSIIVYGGASQYMMVPMVAAGASVWCAAKAGGTPLDADKLRGALASFSGVKRRFEFYVNTPKQVYMDDYAHHPRELAATLTSVRKMFPGRRITALFQPHLYTRTRDLHAEFAEALSHADEVVLLPIYPAREEPIPGITSEIIARRVAAPCRIVDRDHLADEVAAMDTDVVISFGAGNIDACCPALAERLKMKS